MKIEYLNNGGIEFKYFVSDTERAVFSPRPVVRYDFSDFSIFLIPCFSTPSIKWVIPPFMESNELNEMVNTLNIQL